MSTFMIDLKIAFLSLIQHRRRALFLGLAIAGVTGLLTLLNGLSTGIRYTMVNTATTLSTGHINVGGFFKVSAGQSAPVVTDYQKVIDVVKAKTPELEFVVQRGRGWAKIISDQGSMQAGIGGIDIVHEPAFKQVIQVVDGNIDDLSQPNTIMLFEDHLKKLSVRIGDAITLSAQTSRGTANTIDCRVVAIARDIGLLSKWNVYVPDATLRALYQLRPDATGALHLHLKKDFIKDLLPIAARLRTNLEAAGFRVMEGDPRAFWMKFQSVNREDWTGQKLDVTTWEDELSFMMWTLQILDGLTLVLMVILIAIIVTGITNTMWIAIRERTREIGTLRAIGMRRGGVMRMFILESLMLGLLGTVAGAIGGTVVATAINAAAIKVPLSVQLFLMSNQVHLRIDSGQVLFAIGLITAVTGLAALFPALRAARLKPVVAMSR